MIIKQFISATLVLLIVSAIALPTITVVNFYAHQDEIILEHCENIDKPELNCNGHCYLKAKLATEINVNEGPSLQFDYIYIPIAFFETNKVKVESIGTKMICHSVLPAYEFSIKTYISEIFIPPKIII